MKYKNKSNLIVTLFILIFISGIAFFTLNKELPILVGGLYLFMSIVTFIAYAIDKSAARNGKHRIRESTLHFFALAGGWPGALYGKNKLRHKSSKNKFKRVLWLTIILNLAGLVYFLKLIHNPLVAG